VGALLYSAFTHHYKSQLKKQSCLVKGGGRTGLDQNKRKLNDVGLTSKTGGGQPRGKTGQGTILTAREQERVEGYSRKRIRKYRRTWTSTIYMENEEGRTRVDSSGKKQWRSREQKDREIMTKAVDRDRAKRCSRRSCVGGGTEDKKLEKQQQPFKPQQAQCSARSAASGTSYAWCVRQGSAYGREEETRSETHKLEQDDNSKEKHWSGKRKRGVRELGNNKILDSEGAGQRGHGAENSQQEHKYGTNERAGSKGNQISQQDKEGREAATSYGPMDKYLRDKCSFTRQQNSLAGTGGTSSARIVDPKNPRKRPNRRTRRLHLQLYKTQSQPTLNWYGFKREIEEKQIHSADFAEEITYEAMERLYKVEDFTIIGLTCDRGTDTEREESKERLAEGVRIVSLNIRTLTKHKLPVLAWYMQKYEVDCMMLQDVGCTEFELRYHRVELKSLLGDETVVTISAAGQHGGEEGQVGGLMTIIQTRLGLRFLNHNIDKLNLGLTQTTTCIINGQTLNMINTYWPVENKEGPYSLWNTTIREMRKRDIKGTPLQYVQDTILRARDKLVTETPGSLVLIGGDLNSTIRKEERGGRATPLDKWIIEAKLVSVRECLTGDDTEARKIER